jgi:hypothetical protein
MAGPTRREVIATDWGVKETPKVLYWYLMTNKYEFLRYYSRGNNHEATRMQYQVSLYMVYYSCRKFFKDFLKKEKKEDLIQFYDKLAYDKTVSVDKLLQADADFMEWAYSDGPFRISDTVTEYEDMFDQLEDDDN